MGAKGHEHQRELRGWDIGHGVRIRFYTKAGDSAQQRAGLIRAHRHEDGAICEGAVAFDLAINQPEKDAGDPVWRVVSWDPLTLDPSLLDKECGLHGHITNGLWVPA